VDIKATVNKPHTSIQYTTVLFDGVIDKQRLTNAYNKLVETHDILRSVFVETESIFYQVVLSNLEVPLLTHKVEGTLEQGVEDLCTQDADAEFCLGAPFLQAWLVEASDSRTGLVVRLSHAQYDGVSLPRLLRDLETLYSGDKVDHFVSFPAYVAAIHDEAAVKKAQAYWRNLLTDSSLSTLEGTSNDMSDRGLFLSKEVQTADRPSEITTSNLLTAAWALFLSRQLKTLDVTFGAVTSGRNVDLQNVEDVVGPCYNIMPVRVQLQSHWTAMDLLRHVQTQMAESSAHDFLGFSDIARQFASWGL
jgi:hypothetical protein